MQLSGSKTKSRGAAVNWDVLEKVIVVLLLGGLALRLIPDTLSTHHYQNWLLLLAESCIVVFVLFRRPTDQISLRPIDWLLGFGGTLAALLVAPAGDTPVLPVAVCSFFMIVGFLVQLWAKFTLRRSFGVIAANRGVKASGPYRLVRHPMYAGYALIHIGFLLSGPVLWNVLIYTLATALNIARIIAEERVLIADPAYKQLCGTVRYRLIPFVF